MPGNYLQKSFRNGLKKQFNEFCASTGTEATSDNLIDFLDDRNFFPEKTRAVYATHAKMHEFQNEDMIARKTHGAQAIADLFNLSERTVWNHLKEQDPTLNHPAPPAK